MNIITPLENESYDEYKLRLSINKAKYNLSWKDISDNIYKYFHKKISKDYIRHEYYSLANFKNIKINNGYKKTMIINDIHLPYQREDVFNEIEKHKDTDYLIIAGDLVDCESCSFWKSFKHPDVHEELIIAHDFISKVNKIINPEKTQIIAIKGNHEERYTKDIINLQEKQMQKLLNPNLLSMLENGFTYYEEDKIITYKPIENFKYIDNWYVRLFDNLIAVHPQAFSAIDGRLNEKVAEYFLNEGIAKKDDVIVYAHTHKHSTAKVNRRQGVYVIENGCMCKPMEYAKKSAKLSYTPQNYCYSVIEFKEGEKIDLNNIDIIHLK